MDSLDWRALPALPRDFYTRTDVVQVAKDLLGKLVVSRTPEGICGGRIVETEAYRAPDDKACHAHGNKRTRRTETMFATGGTAYVYLIYGMYDMLNVVTGPAEQAQAVLIRALEPVVGIELMQTRRKLAKPGPRLTNGPGILCRALAVTRAHDGTDLTATDGSLFLLDAPSVDADQIVASPRVNVDYAGECAAWPWRFREAGNRYTSPAK